MWPSKTRSELSVGLVCHVRWITFDAPPTCGSVVTHPRWEPMRESRTAGFVRGRIARVVEGSTAIVLYRVTR
jgi:hypothetical protein